MLIRMTAAMAAFGVTVLAASGAIAAPENNQRHAASALAQQFDAAAPHYVMSDHFTDAMALRREARANFRHGHYGLAASELRTALKDIRVLPRSDAGVPPPPNEPPFPGLRSDSG